MSSTEKQLSFDSLPDAVAELMNKVEILIDLVNKKLVDKKADKQEEVWMDLNELCEYLPGKPTKPTVYTWVCNRQIPFYKKTKRLYFLKSEIDSWMIKSGHSTAEDMKDIALETFGYRKGGLR